MLNSFVVQTFGYGNAFADVPALSIVRKNSRGQDLNSKLIRSGEVPDIVSDNGVRPARYRQFEDKFVAWVP